MKERIEALKENDLILILAPAKAIEEEHVLFAQEYLQKQGFRVRISENCLGQHHYFSGDEGQRLSDFQHALDNPEVKAILCARGGYGCVQIVDRIRWANQLTDPKWIVGFSDVTVFHQKMQRIGGQSIHGSMPLNFSSNSSEALETLIQALKGNPIPVSAPAFELNKKGSKSGRLIGGNLSILYSLLGTDDQPDYSGSILFIEDLAEQTYHIDRMFHAFSKAGILDKINGLVIGGMTDLKDTAIPFGKSYEEVILSHFEYRNLPIAFNFPAGHIDDNRALVLGREVELTVDDQQAIINYI